MIEYAVAILVRHALVVADFSFMCRDLIRELFLTAAPCAALRRFSVFFEDYFESEEWAAVVARLYKNEDDYLAITEEARLYRKYLEDKDPTRTDGLADHQFILKSIFKGGNGRKHTWLLKDAHPTKNLEEIAGALQILPLLSIFETNGVRKFTEFVDFLRYANIPDLHYAKVQEEQAESVAEAPVKAEAKAENKKMDTPQAPQTAESVKKAKKDVPEVKHNELKELPATASSDLPLTKDSVPPERRRGGKTVLEEVSEAPESADQDLPPEKAPRGDSQNTWQKLFAMGGRKSKESSFGKSIEQIEKERDERKKERRLTKIIGRRGKG